MDAEEVVVFRLEGVGPFAVPVSVLGPYLVPRAPGAEQEQGEELPAGMPVPLILAEDFLRGRTERRSELVIDRYGCVGLPDRGVLFEPRTTSS